MKDRIKHIWLVRRGLRLRHLLRRAVFARSFHRGLTRTKVRWLQKSRELTNLSYHLKERNLDYLAAFLAVVTGGEHDQARRYIDEALTDVQLAEHIQSMTSRQPEHIRRGADDEARYGRRVGWYAAVRLLKPKVVAETGVDKGLGSVLLCAALLRNREEGHPGYYYGTDIRPSAGWLLSGGYAEVGEVLYGDSIASLKELDALIGLMVNDSDHSASYERDEYLVVESKLADGAVVLGDNATVTGELLDWSKRTGRQFLFWREEPADHWHPGNGIGAAF